jgi:hypothetical protein
MLLITALEKPVTVFVNDVPLFIGFECVLVHDPQMVAQGWRVAWARLSVESRVRSARSD